jgi:hypothetical protein
MQVTIDKHQDDKLKQIIKIISDGFRYEILELMNNNKKITISAILHRVKQNMKYKIDIFFKIRNSIFTQEKIKYYNKFENTYMTETEYSVIATSIKETNGHVDDIKYKYVMLYQQLQDLQKYFKGTKVSNSNIEEFITMIIQKYNLVNKLYNLIKPELERWQDIYDLCEV